MNIESSVKFNLVLFASISMVTFSCSSFVSVESSHIKVRSEAYHTWPALKNGLGAITGFITTYDSAVASGTNIELLDSAGHLVRKSAADLNGTFTIANIPPGNYTISASLIGYKKAILNNMVVNANTVIHIEVYLTGDAFGISMMDRLRPNQSLKLTAEAGVETRSAQENGFVVVARRQCWTALRIVRKESYQRRSLAPVR